MHEAHKLCLADGQAAACLFDEEVEGVALTGGLRAYEVPERGELQRGPELLVLVLPSGVQVEGRTLQPRLKKN